MHFTAREIATATGGRLIGSDTEVDGVSIDTRELTPGSLFVPIVAERDGHDFVPVAIDAGASLFLTDREPNVASHVPAVVVGDTQQALTALGVAARDRIAGPVVAITGSVAKTSVKDLASAAIGAQRRCHASERSFNNELGVPLTLLNAPDDTEVVIVEMGARGAGHIAHLCDIARPTVGVVTWVGAVHTSEFGSIQAVANAKAELVEALGDDGTAILNADCELVAEMAGRTRAAVMTYRAERWEDASPPTVGAIDVVLDDLLRPRFTVVAGDRRVLASLDVHGRHQVSNALGAVAAALAVGVELDAAVAGLKSARISQWRMELTRTSSGAVLINDAYNANAVSTAAALRSLAAIEASRRIAVLGVMAELGERHDEDHRAMARLCDELGIELIAYNEDAYGVDPVRSIEEALTRLGHLDGDDALLVKGSRVAGLEKLAQSLVTDG